MGQLLQGALMNEFKKASRGHHTKGPPQFHLGHRPSCWVLHTQNLINHLPYPLFKVRRATQKVLQVPVIVLHLIVDPVINVDQALQPEKHQVHGKSKSGQRSEDEWLGTQVIGDV